MNSKDSQASSAPAPRKPISALFETAALILLSLATVGTAWCSFQAAAWGGLSTRMSNLSAAASRRAAVAEVQSFQMKLADVLMFTQYLNAHASSNETLARFYSDRFRGEAKVAFEAWMATKPFEDPKAPPHPFVAEFYKSQLLADSAREEAEAQRLWQEGSEAGRTSRAYVLITVLLATALFCAGSASRFTHQTIRQGVLWLGVGALVFAAARLLLLSVQL